MKGLGEGETPIMVNPASKSGWMGNE